MAHDHEKITYGMNEVKELFDASVLTGTIVSVDTDNDKAHVNISGFGQINDVPIFYHCEGESTTEGGSTAFSDGDNVYILNKKGRISPGASDLQIVGFVDGLKSCGFQFKLRRGDGKLVTELLDGYFDLYNSKKEWISSLEFTYDEESEYWLLTFDKEDIDEDGYFVFYDCDDGLETQYPFRYKDADQFQEADLIQPATYEDIIPHWKISYDYAPTPNPEDELMSNRYTIACAGATDFATFADIMWEVGLLWKYTGSTSVQKRFILESSVPFWCKHEITKVDVDCFFEQHDSNQCSEPMHCTIGHGADHDGIVNIVSSDGDIDIEVTNEADNPYIGAKKPGSAKIITYTITDLTATPVNLTCAPPWWPNPGTPYQSPVISVYCGLKGGVSFYYE